jgi:hypothetical protein
MEKEPRKNTNRIVLTLNDISLKRFRTVPTFKEMLWPNQLDQLKIGDNELDVNNTILGKLERMQGPGSYTLTKIKITKESIIKLIKEVISEQGETSDIDSTLKQTLNQLGKELVSNSDEIVQDNNKINEAVGIVLVAGIALAIPEIVKLIGKVTKVAGKLLGGKGTTGEAIIAKAKKMHHMLVHPIEWALIKLGIPKDKAHTAAGVILTTVVAGLMVTSGVGAYKAATTGSTTLAGLEAALTAVKGGEVTTFLSKSLAAI